MKKGLIGVQMSTIAPAKMPSFDAFDAMKKLTDIGYHCIEISGAHDAGERGGFPASPSTSLV